MNRTLLIAGVAALALVAATGFATATSGAAPMQADDSGGWFGPAEEASPADRALNASNSPWLTGDDRLDRIQDRFDLTDEQVSEIRTEVQSLVEANATHDEIRATVTEMLESYGVEDPTLGPPVERSPGTGAQTTHSGGGAYGSGYGWSGSGHHGPTAGHCMS